jgi:Putative serine esterase (DUF676)
MGGLVSRYAIGLLYADKFFDNVKPVNFTTFATPHLGTRKPSAGSPGDTLVNRTFNFLIPKFIGRTGTFSFPHFQSQNPQKQTVIRGPQLFLEDNDKEQPLLVAMAEEESDYFKALQLFPRISLYANVAQDFLVPYFTSCKQQHILHSVPV